MRRCRSAVRQQDWSSYTTRFITWTGQQRSKRCTEFSGQVPGCGSGHSDLTTTKPPTLRSGSHRSPELDIARFPDPEDVLATLRAMGFERVDHQADNEVVTRGVGAWLAAADAGFISTLQLVDPEEKRRGIRAFSAIHTDQSATFSYTIRFTLMMAMRP